jgi:hypothetical protein
MFENTPARANWTYKDEEAIWHAAHPPVSQKYMDMSIADKFSLIKKTFAAEFAQYKDFLDGKLNMSGETYYAMFDCKLYYIMFPQSFEADVSEIEGELDSAGKAWITNTRKLIRKYYLVYMGQQSKLWPKNAEIYAEEAKEVLAALDAQKKTAMKVDRSKVCRIANKIDRSVSRKEAFTTAWQIVKNGGLEIKVAGVSFYSRQEALRRLATYDPRDIRAFLVPEYENEYDANAIAVMVMAQGGKGVYRIGYAPKEETAIVKAFLGTVPEFKVLDGDIRGAKVRLAA